MADCCFSPVACAGTIGDAFYFHVVAPETEVDVDSFGISQQCLHRWVRSKDNKYLLLNSNQEFEVQNLMSEELNQPDCKFKLQIYNNLDVEKTRVGRAVMLYVENNEGKTIVACCGDNLSISAEELDPLPKRIEEAHHKAVFYMTKLSPCKTFQFESSVHPLKFLGFEPDGENPSLNKLVLHHKGKDEVDINSQVMLI